MKLLQKTMGTLAVISLLGVAQATHAEETVVNATVNTTAEAPKPTVPRNEMDAKREALRKEMELKKLNATAEVRANMEVRKETRASTTGARMEDREEKMEVRKDERRAKAETMIKKHATQMTQRLSAAVERLEKIATRIDSRITKLKSEGVATATAEASVTSARTTLITIKADIATIPTVLASSFSQNELKGSLKPLETLAKKIRGDIQSVHKSLETATSALKAVSSEKKVEVKTEVRTEGSTQ